MWSVPTPVKSVFERWLKPTTLANAFAVVPDGAEFDSTLFDGVPLAWGWLDGTELDGADMTGVVWCG